MRQGGGGALKCWIMYLELKVCSFRMVDLAHARGADEGEDRGR